MRVAYTFYQVLGWLGLMLGWPLILARAIRDPRYRVGWAERFGRWGGATGERPLWVHAASVGEVRAAQPLLAALRGRGAPLLVSTTSPSGRAAAASSTQGGEEAHLLPLDLAPFVRRVIRSHRPRALVIVETELWPSLLAEARGADLPILLVNARISDRSFPRYQRMRRWLRPLLESFFQIQAQSAADADRFLALGAPAERVVAGGNLKFDVAAPSPVDAEVAALRRARAGGWRVVIAGSTHSGEEEAVLRALAQIEEGGVRAALVLAPRHLERLEEAEAAIRAAGRAARRWSSLGQPLEPDILSAFERGDVILVDRYGLLGRLYGAAEVSFVGGTLVPVGGHNLLEPLRWGIPVVFGPHTANAREVRDEVLRRELGAEAADAGGLAEAWGHYLSSPAVASAVRAGAERLFQENRGAVERAVAALEILGALDRNH